MQRLAGRGVGVARQLGTGVAIFMLVSLPIVFGAGGVAMGRPTTGSGVSHSSNPDYAVNFSATDVPFGTYWSVNLSGISESAFIPWILFSEPNGTYAYRATTGLSGALDSVNGTIAIRGASLQPAITFGLTDVPGIPTSAPGAGSSAGPGPVAFWIAAVSIGAALAGLGALVATQLKRRRSSPRSPGTRTGTAPPLNSATPNAPSPDDALGHMV